MENKDTPGGDGYECYLDCGDGFHSFMYMSKFIKLYTLTMCGFLVSRLYLNTAVVKICAQTWQETFYDKIRKK